MSGWNWVAKGRTAAMGAAVGLSLALGACAEEAAAPVEVEGVYPGIEVTNARLVLPPVSGNPAAVYFDVAYNGERGISITGAEVEGAESASVHAMMEYNFEMTMAEAGPIAVRGGESQSFEPGGFHIMVNGLDESIAPGSTAKVTLKIVGGKTHKFDAEVRAAGEER
ncbi:MAG: copper chaperone PCu(A)C [Erythrobacter sp.]|uniref:copper chaperone PCu(A)C n=1 Tax=Erythrobacter sp. TaxID=1042 RepID=UPI00262DDE1E|nr:copper chaperone PCu(A)C [Erythrobacter sp.]MDJ0977717.1 copper chaperone PCu(A)C [Erythrobacter sp.]